MYTGAHQDSVDTFLWSDTLTELLCVGEAELDPLPHVIRGIKARAHLALHRRGPGAVPSRLDKYDVVQQVLASDAPAGQWLSAGPPAAWHLSAHKSRRCKHPYASDLLCDSLGSSI